jgi:Zn-dependent protease with chaperone function
MAGTALDSIAPYTDISPKAYEHPSDRAATAALKSIPLVEALVRKLIEWQYEKAIRQVILGNAIKVGKHQLPDLWTAHQHVCRVLDMPSEYPVYVARPVPGIALAVGSNKPLIVIDAGALENLGPGEQRAVLAHELGHILSDHMVYQTALVILLSASTRVPFLFALPYRGLELALLEWSRCAELTCDRAAAIAVRDPQIVCRELMIVSGGLPGDKLNLDAFMAQAMEYEEWKAPGDRLTRFFQEINATHPYSVKRVCEIMKWVQSGEYDRIIRGDYRKRSDPADLRDEGGDAVAFYAARFRSLLKDVGENITSLGQQVGGVAEQATDWLGRAARAGRGASGGRRSSGSPRSSSRGTSAREGSGGATGPGGPDGPNRAPDQ